jgi:hypothetical protein
MLHTEVVFLDLTIYYLIQKWKLFVQAQLLFNIRPILTKMVLNYFEVMIIYIIAVSLHVRRNNVFRYLSTSIFTDDITTIMISYCLICTGPSIALAMTILHRFYLWKQMDNKCEWGRKNLFLFYILQSWAVLHWWITLLLHKTYFVGIVWPLL